MSLRGRHEMGRKVDMGKLLKLVVDAHGGLKRRLLQG
jgi:hypothetical protein